MLDSPEVVIRGCGERVPGGIYAECDTSSDPNALPVEEFLLDPPIRSGDLNLPARGVVLREINGVWHIIDRVGERHYPNVADFVEEVRAHGLSRRLSSSLDFSLLTPESKIVLAHARAWVDNCDDWPSWVCPQGKQEHTIRAMAQGCCAGIWWEDVEGGKPTESTKPVYKSNPVERPVSIVRNLPSSRYFGNPRPQDVIPVYEEALFLRLPVHRLVTVAASDGSHQSNLFKASKSALPVEEVSR